MITLRPKHPEARRLLALAHYTLGEVDEAIAVFEEWLREEPDDPIARHMLAACSGRDVPARASDAFVEKTFDSFAASFDAKLASLAYRAPALVAEMLAHAGVDASRSLDVLDAGCGTGLCGPLVAPYARRLVGVDLSEGMLARARARNVYDELAKGELTAYLRDSPGSFDVIVSADTLVYFGSLEAVAAAAASALRPGGVLVFTVEELSDAASDAGTPSARTGATATRPATSSACWRMPDCSRRSFPPSCASRLASRSRGWSCERRRRARPAKRAPSRRLDSVRGGECGGVETFGGVERSLGLLRRVSSERAAQEPPAAEPNEVQAVVGRVGRALGMEIQVDRQLPDESRVGGGAGRLLEPVRDQRGEHLQFAHTRADGDSGRERARGDHHPRHPRQAGAASRHAHDRHGGDDEPLELVRAGLELDVAGEQALALGGGRHALLAQRDVLLECRRQARARSRRRARSR